MTEVATHPTFWSGSSVVSACCSHEESLPSYEAILSSVLAQTSTPGMASLGLLGRRAENTRHAGVILPTALTVGTTQKGSLSADRMPVWGNRASKCCIAKWSAHCWAEPSGILPGLDPQKKKPRPLVITGGLGNTVAGSFPSSRNAHTQYLMALWRKEAKLGLGFALSQAQHTLS